jgi:hypothetical protein
MTAESLSKPRARPGGGKRPGGRAIQQFWRNHSRPLYGLRHHRLTVIASDGRTMRGVIEDSMLSAETLAKTLLLQLHQGEQPPD